jgi:hypothetical protein
VATFHLGLRALGVEAQHPAAEGLLLGHRQHAAREVVHRGHVARSVELDHADVEAFEQVQGRDGAVHGGDDCTTARRRSGPSAPRVCHVAGGQALLQHAALRTRVCPILAPHHVIAWIPSRLS